MMTFYESLTYGNLKLKCNMFKQVACENNDNVLNFMLNVSFFILIMSKLILKILKK